MTINNDIPHYLANIEAYFDVSDATLTDFTVQEIVLVESLKTPGLQTTVKVHSYAHIPGKNLDEFKNKIGSLTITRPILTAFGYPHELEVNQRVYRLSNRKLINNQNEEFVIHMCDDSLLNDARSLVSHSWKCTTPSDVVKQVLQQCAGVSKMDVESSQPARDYIAENIHPFQVVTQQADVALNGDDPSFLHWMTYDNGGVHHFKSLKTLVKGGVVAILSYNETGGSRDQDIYEGYRNPNGIMQYSFPCDFDLLSDLLNGVDANGKDINSLIMINPLSKESTVMGNQAVGCGIGGGQVKQGLSNKNTEQDQDSCNIDIENHLLKRQARMNLLDNDKVGLRLTVPWNPVYHAGKMITVNLYNKNNPGELLTGSGNYLISTMVHTIKRGGFSTTTMDCVYETVGQGGVV